MPLKSSVKKFISKFRSRSKIGHLAETQIDTQRADWRIIRNSSNDKVRWDEHVRISNGNLSMKDFEQCATTDCCTECTTAAPSHVDEDRHGRDVSFGIAHIHDSRADMLEGLKQFSVALQLSPFMPLESSLGLRRSKSFS